MICYKETLAQCARTIIDSKSTSDEIKAACDIAQAENMLSAINPYLITCVQIPPALYNNAVVLDNQLRQDYAEIDILQACANQLGSLVPNQNQVINFSDDIAHRLRMDVRGIFTATLIKHKIIGRVDEALQQATESDEKKYPHDGMR